MLTETAIACHAHNLRSGPDHSPDMLSKHKRHYGLGMDALVSVCSRNTHVNYYGSGKDALVSGCSRNTHVNYYGSGIDALVSGCH